MEAPGFEIVFSKQCNLYAKQCYQLAHPIDEELIGMLGTLGSTEQIFAGSLPLFRISNSNELLITGSPFDNTLHLTLPKFRFSNIERVESVLQQWTQTKSKNQAAVV